MPRNFVTSGTVAYFFAYDSTNSPWLWRSDGTAAGTEKITQVGLTSGQISKGMTAASGRLFYRTGTIVNSFDRLFTSDGTDEGTTQMLANAGYSNADGELYAWFNRPRMPQAGNFVYFSADRSPTDPFGRLFAIDTQNLTASRLDISLGYQQTGMVFGDTVGTTLYFDYATTVGQAHALFRTDGTDESTTGIYTLTDTGYLSYGMWRIPNTAMLVLGVHTTQQGMELWRSDGTDAGTTIVKDINPQVPTGNFPLGAENGSSMPHFFGELGDSVYFTANTSSFNPGPQLWRTDGTEEGTTMVRQLQGAGWHTFHIPGSIALNNELLFSAYGPGDGYELWKTNGTEAGTTVVKSINPGLADASPSYFTRLNATEVIFRATGPNGQELWKTDGTPEGTVEIKDIYPGPANSAPWDFTVLPGGIALFRAAEPDHGYELWRTDGTTVGTYMVMDLNTLPSTATVTDWQSY